MIPLKYLELANGKSNRAALRAASEFAGDMWDDYDPSIFTFLGTRHGDRWRDHPIQGEDRRDQIMQLLAAHSPKTYDIYFCSNGFRKPHRRTEYAACTRYAQCDIDDADPAGYYPRPSILWETSPDRFQGIWRWNEAAEGRVAERYSENIWKLNGGDKGG